MGEVSMTEHQIALARRAAAAPGWRWLPGMLTACRVRVHECGPDYIIGHRPGPTKDGGGMVDTIDLFGFVPDLSDDLTALGLLALVRERWGTTAHLVRFDTNVDDGEGGTKPACWWALAVGLASRPFQRWDGRLRYIAAPTEVEVLVLALEVVP
jgi:hypothetical protein